MTTLGRLLPSLGAAVTLLAASCYSYQHYTGDAEALDYMFFGKPDSKPGRPVWIDDAYFRTFYLLGLGPYNTDTTTVAANALAARGASLEHPLVFDIRTQKGFYVILSEMFLPLPVALAVQFHDVKVRSQPDEEG